MPSPHGAVDAEELCDEVPCEAKFHATSHGPGLGARGALATEEGVHPEEIRVGIRSHNSMHMSHSSCSLDSASEVHVSGTLSDAGSSIGRLTLRTGSSMPAPELEAAGLPPLPGCFRCPISQQIMEDPVTLEDGRTYERSSVGSLGYEGAVVPNEPLREAIQGYLELQRDIERRQGAWLHHMARHEQRVNRTLVHRKKQVTALREALDHSRRRVMELSGRRKTIASSASTSASSHEDNSSGTPTGSDRSAEERCHEERSAEDQVVFRSGPAPRRTETAIAPVGQRRSSAWSRLLGRRGGA